MFCHNPNDISVEIRQANSFASDKFAEADITLKEKNHSRWLTLQLHKPHDRWLIADVDNIDDPLPSLGRQLHNDTQLKLLIAPQLAINNQKLQMLLLQNYLLIQTNTIAEKFAFVVWSSLALSATLFMAIHSKMDYGWKIFSCPIP